MPSFFSENNTPRVQDTRWRILQKILGATIAGGGGGGGSTAMKFAPYGAGDAIPVDGSIDTQAVWNTDTGHVFWNTAWPNTAAPVWEAH